MGMVARVDFEVIDAGLYFVKIDGREVAPEFLGYDGVAGALRTVRITVLGPMLQASLKRRPFAMTTLSVGAEDEYLAHG